MFDEANRLIQRLYYQYSWMHATNGDQRTDLVYDGQGRLRKRLEYYIPAIQQGTNSPPDSLTLELGVMGLPSQPNWTLESETWYVYDGKRVIQERNGSNTPQVSYTRGTDLSGSLEGAGGIGGLLARSEGSAHASYFADGNGNITSLSGGNLAVVASYRYDPYGNLLFKSGAWADTNVYRFSSKECHVKSGLYYYLYRWYSPELQRWPNRDPLAAQMPQKSRLWGNKLHVELEQGPNLYWPFRNAPVNNHDPDGQFVPVLVCAIIAGVVVCGCSKAPEPPPNDPYGCWASTDPKKLGKIPGQGGAKPVGCLARQTGCFECCEKNEPIKGGDPQKYAECIAACEQNYRKCAGLSTSGPRE